MFEREMCSNPHKVLHTLTRYHTLLKDGVYDTRAWETLMHYILWQSMCIKTAEPGKLFCNIYGSVYCIKHKRGGIYVRVCGK
jgi:hypothetical protein